MPNPVLEPEAVQDLIKRLAECPQVSRLTDGEHDEAGALAHALLDLAEASAEYSDLFPDVMKRDLRGDRLVARLIDASLVLQHLAYHLEDSRFLSELLEPLREEWRRERGHAE